MKPTKAQLGRALELACYELVHNGKCFIYECLKEDTTTKACKECWKAHFISKAQEKR